MKIIFDLGANTGLNIPYYLMKAEKVIAVEANVVLANAIEREFAPEVMSGRLVVVKRAVTTKTAAASGRAPFYTYQGEKETGHVWSSLERPTKRHSDFVEVDVQLTHPEELFMTYGEPHFVKIDIEHHDVAVLRDILARRRPPAYLSVEAHDSRVLGLVLLEEEFKGFKIVRGRHVSEDFSDLLISTNDGPRRLSFSHHSAGPYGNDIPGPWLDRSTLVQHYGHLGPGWLDIHATTQHVGEASPRLDESLPSGARELASLSARAALRALSAAISASKRRVRALWRS